MNRAKIVAFLVLAMGLTATLVANSEGEIVRYRANAQPNFEFKIHPTKDPIYPLSLKNRGIANGSTVFAIYVNQFGELEDFLLLEADHLDFAKSVERVIPEWSYSVPLIDGEIASITSKIRVNFTRGRGVVYETIGYQTALPAFQDELLNRETYRVYNLDELDSIPIPKHVEKPSFHDDMLEERDIVNAVFEFYIDSTGNVRIPTLREADDRIDERLLVIAQEALLQWKFEPPLSHRRPVVARAAQPFRFKKSELKSTNN
ncbi:hypothetical protein [Pelagicoccus sp. SDUM812002]|uniref:hypothetical protein n=1 Tax=Pelagicoccus sp. SDUM812002 TaxID=3041266 RepID=UPI00280D6827|nr:hypothetical protein [Pelagicoccus sp. SDUM812002]MDQ8184495.1 hypothetical protein [Pelagicoccus sp. SDUM812002]